VSALRVYTAASDTGTKCCRCRGAIRAGQEFSIEPWPSGGGFDHLHVECPNLEPMQHPERRVVQGSK
jgi:hypothetical protein